MNERIYEPTDVVLRDERMVLRVGQDGDIPQIIAFHDRNRAHFETIASPKPDEWYTTTFWEEKLRLARTPADPASIGFFVFRAEDHATQEHPEIIGFVSFANPIRGAFQACILGYGIDAGVEGQGYMTGALRLAIPYVFDQLGIHRIMANHAPTNVRSGRVLRKLGFIPEGYARDYLLVHGEWQDHVLTALTNHDWKPLEERHKR